jgi:hypothetical protein
VCANDLAGAYGARHFVEQLGLTVHAFSGPVIDNAAGTEYLSTMMRIPAFNARVDLDGLGGLALQYVESFEGSQVSSSAAA